jgi:hypothetical protein
MVKVFPTLLNQKFHHDHKIQWQDPALNQVNAVHRNTVYFYISIAAIWILFTYLLFKLPKWFHPVKLSEQMVYAFLTFPIIPVCFHPPWFYHPNKHTWRVKAIKIIIIKFCPVFVTLCRLGPNKSLITLSTDNLYPCPSFTLRDKVSHLYKTAGEIKMIGRAEKTTEIGINKMGQ